MSKRHKVKRPKLGVMVYVEMDDIQHGQQGWSSFVDIAKRRPLTFRAMGWVVRTTKRTLTISPLIDSVESDAFGYCSYMLPMRSITRIDLLK